MNRYIKKAIWVFAGMILLSVCVTGCNENSQHMTGGSEIKYLVMNPIEVEEIQTAYGFAFVKISGLKDKHIEDKINQKIQEEYERFAAADLPPYRGIKKAVPEDAETQYSNIYCYVSGNFNHVLSVQMIKNETYLIPDENGEIKENAYGWYENQEYVGDIILLNFDLNTGNLLTLKDVFADGTDYIAVLNELVRKKIAEENGADETNDAWRSTMQLVAPFESIKPDHKFTFYETGISLYFDYDTPEFDTYFHNQSVHINFDELGDIIVLHQRYYDENTDIFESEDQRNKRFVVHTLPNQKIEKNEMEMDQVTVWQSLKYSEEVHENILKAFDSLTALDDEILKKCAGRDASYSIDGNMYQIGDYIQLSVITRYDIADSGEYYYGNCDLLYDRHSGEKVPLSDLFVEGFDYLGVIEEAFQKELSHYNIPDLDFSIFDPEHYTLNYDWLYLYTKPVKQNYGDNVYPIGFLCSFEDIGQENMTIFD